MFVWGEYEEFCLMAVKLGGFDCFLWGNLL